MIRITGGEFRGRLLKTPPGKKTRPSHSMLRQALYNSIQTRLSGARVLDLFSGSGALGFEALSRGAKEVVFVESSSGAIGAIKENIKILKVESQCQLIPFPIDRARKKLSESEAFDLVLADPPYHEGWEFWMFDQIPWSKVINKGGLFCVEWYKKDRLLPERFEPPCGEEESPSTLVLQKVREKNYGESWLTTYERTV